MMGPRLSSRTGLLAGSLFVFIASCSSPSGPGGSEPPLPDVVDSSGGEVVLDSEADEPPLATVRVPPGSVDEPVRIQIRETATSPTLRDNGAIGQTIDVGPSGLTFSRDVEISIWIRDELLGEIGPSRLTIVSQSSGGVERLDGVRFVRDGPGLRVFASTRHFSLFSIATSAIVPQRIPLPVFGMFREGATSDPEQWYNVCGDCTEGHKEYPLAREDETHAVDLNLSNNRDIGLPALAVESGTVVSWYGLFPGTYDGGSFGAVLVRHDSGWYSAYLHLKDITVKAGDRVAPGQMVGVIWNSSAGAISHHLHYAAHVIQRRHGEDFLVSQPITFTDRSFSLDLPGSISLGIGDRQQVSARVPFFGGRYSIDDPRYFPNTLWSSENPGVARVDGNGLVTGVNRGATRIHLKFSGQTWAIPVTVEDTPAPPRRTLAVEGSGDGGGSVTSSPAGIACSVNAGSEAGDCRNEYDDGISVTLTASAQGESDFAGWSGGGCTGTGVCRVTMDRDHMITARFDRSQPSPTPSLALSNEDGFIDAGGVFQSAKEQYSVGESGGDFVYQVIVTNNGQVPASGVRVVDQVAPNIGIFRTDFVRGGFPTKGSVRAFGAGGFTWDVGTLSPGESAEIQFMARATAVGTDVNRARLSADGLGGEVVDEESTTIGGGIELETSHEDGFLDAGGVFQSVKDQFQVGEQGPDFVYQIILTNNGSVSATGVVVQDVVAPNSSRFRANSVRSGFPTGGSVGGFGPGGFSWTIGTLAPGQSVELQFMAEALSPGSDVNRILVSADQLNQALLDEEPTNVTN